jgi:hypothetical protein
MNRYKKNFRKFYNFSQADWTEKNHWNTLTAVEKKALLLGNDKMAKSGDYLIRDSLNLLAWNFEYHDKLTKIFMDKYWCNHEVYPHYTEEIFTDFIKDFIKKGWAKYINHKLAEDIEEFDERTNLFFLDDENVPAVFSPGIEVISYVLADGWILNLVGFADKYYGTPRGFCICIGDPMNLYDLSFRFRCPKCKIEYQYIIEEDYWEILTSPKKSYFPPDPPIPTKLYVCPSCQEDLEVINY